MPKSLSWSAKVTPVHDLGPTDDSKVVYIRVSEIVHRDLGILAATEGTKVQRLMEEAIHDLFAKRGKEPNV